MKIHLYQNPVGVFTQKLLSNAFFRRLPAVNVAGRLGGALSNAPNWIVFREYAVPAAKQHASGVRQRHTSIAPCVFFTADQRSATGRRTLRTLENGVFCDD